MKDSVAASVPARIPHRQATAKEEPAPVPVPSAASATDVPTTNSITAERSNVIEAEGDNDNISFCQYL